MLSWVLDLDVSVGSRVTPGLVQAGRDDMQLAGCDKCRADGGGRTAGALAEDGGQRSHCEVFFWGVR